MHKESEIFKGIRKDIFRRIQSYESISFNRLKNELGMKSNELSYHLRSLHDSGMIEKNEGYSLTEKAKLSYPYLPVSTGEERPTFAVCAVALLDGDKILLQKKPREPEKGSLILFGGKILQGISIEESVMRYAREQAGCHVSDVKLRCVNEFMRKKEDGTFHDIVFFHTAIPEGEVKDSVITMRLDELDDKNLFGDNAFLIKEMLKNEEPKFNTDIKVKQV